MKNRLIYPMVLVLFAGACGGRGGAQGAAAGQQYETVQEGSAAGVTSTIHGPGETLPPITGTNADTTTDFALNPNVPPAGAPAYTPPPASSMTQPYTPSLAGSLPQTSSPTIARQAEPVRVTPQPQPQAQPVQAQPAPAEAKAEPVAEPAAAPQPAPATTTTAEPATDTSETADAPPENEQAEEPPPPPPPM
jgi:hypothetical protein